MKTLLTALLALWAITARAELADPYTYSWHELAPGVWSGVRENGPRVPVMGTSTFVVGDNGVIVFDGGGAPIMSERLMAKIAEVTDKPITHVIISHWHGDHNFGIWRIVEEFPGVQVIAHSFTYEASVGKPIDYVNRAHDAVTRYLPTVEKYLETGMDDDGVTPLTDLDMEIYRDFKKNVAALDKEFERYRKTVPNLTFENKLVIHSGEREVQILFLGAGNTEGDAIMWLPEEKIVATGDVVVRPTPYAYNVYPEKWAATLRALNDLDFDILVPGHGDIQYDRTYTTLMIGALDSVAQQAKQFVDDGLSYDEAMEKFDLSALDDRFTGGDAYIERYYHGYFTEPLFDSAYRWAKGEVLVKLKDDPEPAKEKAEEKTEEDSGGE